MDCAYINIQGGAKVGLGLFTWKIIHLINNKTVINFQVGAIRALNGNGKI